MKQERRIYEAASSDEENQLLELGLAFASRMEPSEGYAKHKRRGRPRKKKRGRPFDFPWQGMSVVLLLKTYLGMDYRKISSHFKAREALIVKPEFERAPSRSQIQRCIELFSESWVRRFNTLVLEVFKKTMEDHPVPIPGWIVPGYKSIIGVPT